MIFRIGYLFVWKGQCTLICIPVNVPVGHFQFQSPDKQLKEKRDQKNNYKKGHRGHIIEKLRCKITWTGQGSAI